MSLRTNATVQALPLDNELVTTIKAWASSSCQQLKNITSEIAKDSSKRLLLDNTKKLLNVVENYNATEQEILLSFQQYFPAIKRQMQDFAENYDAENKIVIRNNIQNLIAFANDIYRHLIEEKTLTELESLNKKQIAFVENYINKQIQTMSEKEKSKFDEYLCFEEHYEENNPEIINRLKNRIQMKEKRNQSSDNLNYLPPLNIPKKWESLKKMEEYLHNLNEFQTSLSQPTDREPISPVYESIYLTPIKEVKQYSISLTMKLNFVAPKFVDDLFFNDLDRYLTNRKFERTQEKMSILYGVKTFFCEKFGFSFSGNTKISAVKKLQTLIRDNNANIKFENNEIAALQDSRLSEIIEKYRTAGALPKAFLDQEAAREKRIRPSCR